jgi:peptidoglycan hydrolase CwlO-like protein
MSDSVKYLRDWAADMRNVSGMSVDADKLDEIANEISDLQARLRIAEKRAEDAEGRDDFLMEILHMTPEELKELRELIKERKQS